MKQLSLILLTALLPTLTRAQTGAQSTYFTQTGADRGYAMCPSGDGNIFVAGRRFDLMLLTKMTPEGFFLSSQYIDMSIGPRDVVADIFLDSDGKLGICGNFLEDAATGGFVLRFDPDANTVLWAKTLNNVNMLINGMVENGSGGNYYVYGATNRPTGIDATILQLDRNTGDLAPGGDLRYQLGEVTEINALTSDGSNWYATGRFADGNDLGDLRSGLLKLDLGTGQPDWTLLSTVDSSKTARLYGRDLIVDYGAIISTFSGNDASDAFDPTFVFLQKTSSDGKVQWIKKYDLTEWNTEFVEEIVSVSDGYVLLGRTLVEDDGWLFILKTDKDGDPQWVKKFEHEYNNDIIGAAQSQLLAFGGYLYFTGHTEHLPNASRMFVVKTDANGQISPGCDALTPTSVEVGNLLPAEFGYPVTLKVSPDTIKLSDLAVPAPTATPLTKLFVCRMEGMPACQDSTDWVLTIDSLVCSGGSMNLHFTLCNDGGGDATTAVPVTFYDKDPTSAAAAVLSTSTLDGALAAGECKSGVLANVGADWFPNGAVGQQTIYAVINDNGALPTPFSFDDFPVTNLPECDYGNNLSSTGIVLDSPVPDLGPDVITCSKDPYVFQVNGDYFAYLWQDGSTGSSYTAVTPGTYWVEVTDYCGFKQRDSVFFTYSLLPDTQFPDTVICLGGAVQFAVPGFDAYAWAPSAGLSCTDCPAVTAQPAATTTYTLEATDNLGCILRDTFTVTVLPNPTQNRVFEFCPGGSVTINGIVYTQPGTVLDTITASVGCDTIVTNILQWTVLPQPSNVTAQCPANVSITIPAGTTSTPITYNPASGGSDCPCGTVDLSLVSGLASGAAFPVGATQVCYRASDACGNAKSCCFTVTVEQAPADDEPCDVKITPCLKFEILGIFQNPAKQKTYRMRVTNTCSGPMTYVAFQLPDGITADLPANNAVYTAPSGRQYEVRNPNSSPFHSVRYRAKGAGISGGQSDIFEYTLPPLTSPVFIHAVARLEPQAFYETHLNIFACDIQQTSSKPADEDAAARQSQTELPAGQLTLYPNPATDAIWLDIPEGEGITTVDLSVLNNWGQVVLAQRSVPVTGGFSLDLPVSWASGLYLIDLRGADGRRWTARFALRR